MIISVGISDRPDSCLANNGIVVVFLEISTRQSKIIIDWTNEAYIGFRGDNATQDTTVVGNWNGSWRLPLD